MKLRHVNGTQWLVFDDNGNYQPAWRCRYHYDPGNPEHVFPSRAEIDFRDGRGYIRVRVYYREDYLLEALDEPLGAQGHEGFDAPVAPWAVPAGVELELEELVSETQDMDKRALYSFRLNYDSLDECRRRLRHTIIIVGDEPVYVIDAYESRNGGYELSVMTHDGKKKKVTYSDNAKINTRSYPPSYVYSESENKAEFLTRIPARISQQGICQQNTQMFPVGIRKYPRALARELTIDGLPEFLSSLRDRTVTEWDSSVQRVLERKLSNNIRLSPAVAVFYSKTRDRPMAEFKNRLLGPIEKGTVMTTDEALPWIVSELRRVGLDYQNTKEAVDD